MAQPALSGTRMMARLDALAAHSETPDGLTRRYLTPEHRAANDLTATWMREAGMAVHQDAVGNIIGRAEGATPNAKALIIGSHLDTVVMAGQYDGMLGVISGIECVDLLRNSGTVLPFAIEVVGFADEEGVRFQSTYLGSRAIAGTFDLSLLDRADADGMTMAQAMVAFGLDPSTISSAARRAEEVLAYLELHIEQGPVLEAEGLAVGAVTAIAGATRLVVQIDGTAGHAGTVPMNLRQDALLAASECALAVEAAAVARENAMATVGRMEVAPGATNVIPGSVHFTVDLRAEEDAVRADALAELEKKFAEIAECRSVRLSFDKVHDAASVACAPELIDRIAGAIADLGHRPLRLPSGAGHDAAAMAELTDAGMIFVRCLAGISHNPLESITEADAVAGAQLLRRVIESFAEDIKT